MRKIKTTKQFLSDFPSGTKLWNVPEDRYYYFDKTRSGKIADGMFWSWLSENELPANNYNFVFDRLTKQTYKLNNK